MTPAFSAAKDCPPIPMKSARIKARPALSSSIEPLELRIAPAFGAIVDLAGLTGPDGLQINGEAAGDRSGFSVSEAGDVNGDGFLDIIIGAFGASPNGTLSGASYVVFGRSTFSAELELASLDGTNGFQINGEEAGDRAGRAVSGAGDVNGDGFADLLIGAPNADPNGIDSGAAYVIFGRQEFPGVFELSTLNGVNGFQISGEIEGDRLGRAVKNAGDIDGDRFDDLIIGAPGADPNGFGSGAAYIIYGQRDSFPSVIEVDNLTGSAGFQINGANPDDRFGRAVSGAGDVNLDGFADVIIGAFRADPNGNKSGAAYAIFGDDITFPAEFELATLTGVNGFQINGELAGDRAGRAVSGARDINADGFDDLLIGASAADPNGISSGASYAIFGRGDAFPAIFELTSLDGTNGFRVNGVDAGDHSGRAVSLARDVNGDNIRDIIIGAPFADPRGNFSGESYIIYGRRGSFDATIELASLDGTNGFTVIGELAGDTSGRSVSAAGDVNGDGFLDFLIGAPAADPNGDLSGATYLVFGQPSIAAPA